MKLWINLLSSRCCLFCMWAYVFLCVSLLSGAGSSRVLHHPTLTSRGPRRRKWHHTSCLGDTGRWFDCLLTDSKHATWTVWSFHVFGTFFLASGRKDLFPIFIKCHLILPRQAVDYLLSPSQAFFFPSVISQPAVLDSIHCNIYSESRIFLVFNTVGLPFTHYCHFSFYRRNEMFYSMLE